MGERYRLELGFFRDRRYVLVAEALPSFNDVMEFAATVYYLRRVEPGEEKKVEVARVDNRSHGHTHFDRLFEPGRPKEPFEGGLWDAVEHLEENWEKYARRYDRNRG